MSRKETTLYVYWSKKEADVRYCYPDSKRDGALLHYHFGSHPTFGGAYSKTLFQELEERGYDLTTLRFSIKKKAVKP